MNIFSYQKSFGRFESGFTLIELLVSMAVLSVLASVLITIVNPLGQFQKAHDAARKTALSQIQNALEQYYQDNGSYPQASEDHKIISAGGIKIEWNNPWTPYMNILPQDPDPAKRTYVYATSGTDGQSYWVYASLERGTADPQACHPDGTACDSAVSNGVRTACQQAGSGSGAVCNYGVSSPNVSL